MLGFYEYAYRVRRDRRHPDVWRWVACRMRDGANCQARARERPAVPTALSRRNNSSQRAFTLVLVAIVLISGLAEFVHHPARAKSASAAVTTSALNLRTGPSLEEAVLLVIPEGAPVDITGSVRRGFYPVAYQGTEGWSHSDYLDFGASSGSSSGAASIASDLNLRAGPSTSETVLAVMPTGASVSLSGRSSNGFLKLTYNGMEGWGFSDYIETGGTGSGPAASDTTPSGDATGSATTTSDLNLRSGPSTGNSVIVVIPYGATVDLLGDPQSGFYPVSYQNNKGWSYGDYLSIGGGGSTSQPASSGGSIVDIIYAAADAYGQNRAAMLQVAQCESVLDPNAVNAYSGASGLFQFLPGTWATTPFASSNIFDPWANANAAAWMWSVGRRGEWVC